MKAPNIRLYEKCGYIPVRRSTEKTAELAQGVRPEEGLEKGSGHEHVDGC